MDVAPRTPAPLPSQPSLPLVESQDLLSPPSSKASDRWDGSVDDDTFQSGAAAYRSACQQLALNRGLQLTWAAALISEPQQQGLAAPAASTTEPALPTLDAKQGFIFACLEAAAKLGKSRTYAMVVALS